MALLGTQRDAAQHFDCLVCRGRSACRRRLQRGPGLRSWDLGALSRTAQSSRDKVRDGNGADGFARIADAAGDLESALGYLFVAAVEVEAEAEGLLALLFEVDMDVEDVLKGDGAESTRIRRRDGAN